jgi:hypothetical protein
MEVNVRSAIAQVTADVDRGQKQVQFATRVALTRVAKKAAGAEEHEMRDTFDGLRRSPCLACS